MLDYQTPYYSSDKGPFQSLSSLPDEDPIEIMEALIAKGGKPKAGFPIPMVLGSSKWIEEIAPDPEKYGKCRRSAGKTNCQETWLHILKHKYGAMIY